MRSSLPRPRSARLVASLALAAGLLAAVLTGAFTPRPAGADGLEAGVTTVRSDDPTSVRFTIRVQSPSGIESATFSYRVLNPDGNVGGSGAASFGPGTEADVTFELATRDLSISRYIPIGSDFVFFWEFVDGDGDTVITPEESYRFLDGRYQWQSRTENGVSVFWYGGNDRNAELAMLATLSVLDSLGRLLETEVPYPVKVVVWRNEREGELAQRSRGGVFDARVITGGSRVAPDLLHVYDSLGNFVDVVRHEAAHITTHVAGDGPFTNVPSWLDEGTAVYTQNDPGANYEAGLNFSIQTDTTFVLRTMQSPANRAEEVDRFYGQSWSTVDFMISEFGEAKFAELYREIYSGERTDDALTTVYGVDQDGLYNLWRVANGLPERLFAPRTASTAVPLTEATRAPLAIPTSVSSAGDSSGGDTSGGGSTSPVTPEAGDGGGETLSGDGSAATGIIVAAITVLLAGGLFGGGALLLRRSRR